MEWNGHRITWNNYLCFVKVLLVVFVSARFEHSALMDSYLHVEMGLTTFTSVSTFVVYLHFVGHTSLLHMYAQMYTWHNTNIDVEWDTRSCRVLNFASVAKSSSVLSSKLVFMFTAAPCLKFVFVKYFYDYGMWTKEMQNSLELWQREEINRGMGQNPRTN